MSQSRNVRSGFTSAIRRYPSYRLRFLNAAGRVAEPPGRANAVGPSRFALEVSGFIRLLAAWLTRSVGVLGGRLLTFGQHMALQFAKHSLIDSVVFVRRQFWQL